MAKATTKKTRVRKPKKAPKSEESVDTSSDSESESESEFESEPSISRLPNNKTESEVVVKAPEFASVTLTGPAMLKRQGRTYINGHTFTVQGEEAISYYETDRRFTVV